MAAADETATFALELKSDMAGTAMNDARALTELRDRIQGDIVALRGMQQAMRNLQGGSVVNIATMRKLRAEIAAKKAGIAQAQNAFIELGGSFKDLATRAKPLGVELGDLLGVIRNAPGPLGALSSQLGGLAGLVGGGAIAGGIVVIAAALAALGAAAVVAAAGLVKYAVAQADARRTELLRLEGMTKVRRFMLGGFGPRTSDSGGFLQQTIDNVTSSVALGRDQVVGLTQDLYRAGLRGGNLQQAAEGAAIALAAGGDEALAQFKAMAMGAGLLGGSVKKVTDDVKARFGAIAKAQLLSVSVQLQKLRENLAALFHGLRIEGFLRGFKVLTDMLSQSTAEGRAIKTILETFLNPLLGAVEMAAPLMKKFFQGMIIGVLTLTLVALRLRNQFLMTFGGADLLAKIDLTNAAVHAGMVTVAALAAGLTVCAAVVGVLAVAFGSLAAASLAPFLLIAKGWQLVKSVDWAGAGKAIVQGIADGIRAGANAVLDAIKSLMIESHKEFKRGGEIRSPSALYRRTAIEIPRGQALGIRAGFPEIRRAARDMVKLPRAEFSADARSQGFDVPQLHAPSAAVGAASVNNRTSVTIDKLIVQSGGDAQDAKALGVAARDAIIRELEAIGVHLGAPTAA